MVALEIRAALYAVIALFLLGCGFAGGLRWDDGVIKGMQLADAKAAAAAQQQATVITQKDAQLAQANGTAEAAVQQALTVHAQVITKEVPRYVTAHQDATGCVTWGMLRVHDAAVLGVDPATVQSPGGQSDDACSTVKPSDFASAIAGNYAVANANAAQLDALEADIRGRVALFNAQGPDAKKPLSLPAK